MQSHVEDIKAISSDHVEFTAELPKRADGSTEFVYDDVMEKALVRKLDRRILPTLWVMYWLNYLDRNNIGNAETAGMGKDLGLSSSDYSLAVSLFFVGYVCLQIPSNLVITRVRPRFYLPGIQFVWGCIVISYIGVHTKGALLAIRFILGTIEAGFFPGALLYMSLWYRKNELARRYAIFYSASQLAGAFGGLLAGAILSGLAGAKGLPAWKWLFLIEGLMTVSFAGVAIWILPDWAGNTAWLSPEERIYAVARLQSEKAADGVLSVSPRKGFMLAIKDWRVWLVLFGQSMATVGGTITYFIPTLTLALGYKGKTAQYMTVPIYCCSLCGVLVSAFSSDYFKERPKHIMAASGFAATCLAITAGVSSSANVRYAFLALGYGGIQACVLLNFAYMGNSFGVPAEKRAVAIGLINGIANLASVYGSYIWPKTSAPRYIPGFATNCACMVALTLTACVYNWVIPRYPEKYEVADPSVETD